jgi:predicted ester cyclase
MKQLLVCIAVLAFVSSCNNATQPVATMSTGDSAILAKEAREAKNKATALASEQGFNSHDVEVIFKDAAPDAVDYGDGSGKPMKNVDSIKANIKVFMAAFPDFKGENLVALADGNQVAVFGEWSGTFKNDMGKMKATGKSFKVKDVDLLTFNDAGKVTEHRSIQSNEAIMNQIMKKK